VVIFAEGGNFLDDLALLVDFDWVDAAVFPFVVEFLDGVAEGFVDFGDAGVEEVAEAEEDGHGGAAVVEAVDDVVEGDVFLAIAVFEADGDIAIGIDVEEVVAPCVDVIEVCGTLGVPWVAADRWFLFRRDFGLFGHWLGTGGGVLWVDGEGQVPALVCKGKIHGGGSEFVGGWDGGLAWGGGLVEAVGWIEVGKKGIY